MTRSARFSCLGALHRNLGLLVAQEITIVCDNHMVRTFHELFQSPSVLHSCIISQQTLCQYRKLKDYCSDVNEKHI